MNDERDMSLDERTARALTEDDHRISREMGAQYGRPPGTEHTSEARDLELWMKQDPTFTPEAEAQVWQEGLGQGGDEWNIKTDIATRKFPFRQQLMKAGRPRVKDQIAFANRMAERAERRAAAQQVEGPPAAGPAPLEEG